METIIPFTGFYESWHMEAIDSQFEYSFQGDNQESLLPEDKENDLYMETSFNKVFIEYAKQYTGEFEAYINDKLKELDSTPIELKFKELVSPKEYNFTTDRIFCDISAQHIKQLHNLIMNNKQLSARLEQLIITRFTSCSGFSSFYSNDFATWQEKSLKEWDHNEVAMLIEALIPEEENEKADDFYDKYDSKILETMQGSPDYDVLQGVPEEFEQYMYHNQ